MAGGARDDDDNDVDDSDDDVRGVDVVAATRRMKAILPFLFFVLLPGGVVHSDSSNDEQDIKRVMKEIWEESKSYRISDAVHMTEKQILARLHRDGLLPLYNGSNLQWTKGAEKERMDQLHFVFLFRRQALFLFCMLCLNADDKLTPRRHDALRNQFAAAVGKRMTSEKIIHTGKNSIMEHHRTVQWSENEYITLAQLVGAQSSVIDRELRGFDPHKALFADYVRMLKSNAQFDAANMAGYNLRAVI